MCFWLLAVANCRPGGDGWGSGGGDICRELEGLSRSDLALRGNVGLFERSEFTHVATRF